MLYVTLNSDYQVIVKGTIDGKKVRPFVYGKLEYDEGCGYLFKPREDYPWDCCTKDEETALAMIEKDVNKSLNPKRNSARPHAQESLED